jgi:hypothetical protein
VHFRRMTKLMPIAASLSTLVFSLYAFVNG